MLCPDCKTENESQDAFCMFCGVRLAAVARECTDAGAPPQTVPPHPPESKPPITCRSCKTENESDDIFCIACGTRLTAAERNGGIEPLQPPPTSLPPPSPAFTQSQEISTAGQAPSPVPVVVPSLIRQTDSAGGQPAVDSSFNMPVPVVVPSIHHGSSDVAPATDNLMDEVTRPLVRAVPHPVPEPPVDAASIQKAVSIIPPEPAQPSAQVSAPSVTSLPLRTVIDSEKESTSPNVVVTAAHATPARKVLSPLLLVGSIAVIAVVLLGAGFLAAYLWFRRGGEHGSGSAEPPTSSVQALQQSTPPSVQPAPQPVQPPSNTGAATPTQEPQVPPAAVQPAQPVPTPAGKTGPLTVQAYESVYVDVQPKIVRQVKPAYPPQARIRKIEDTVVLKILVSERGNVQSVKILRGSQKDPSFNAAAISAVRQWTFKPARKDGKIVSCWYTVALTFRLNS